MPNMKVREVDYIISEQELEIDQESNEKIGYTKYATPADYGGHIGSVEVKD